LKIALVTTLRGWDPQVTRRIEALGYSVEIVRVKSLDPASVEEALRGVSFDYAITPGTSPYDYSLLKGRVVKGTISPKTLPYILELVNPEALSPRVQAEKAVGVKTMVKVSRRIYRDVLDGAVYAFKVGGLGVPLRPPPILVASDVYLSEGRSLDEVLMDSAYRFSEGADILVLSSQPGLSRRVYLDALDRVMSLGKPVAADPGDLGVLADSVDMGAHMAMSLTRRSLASIPGGLRDRVAYVVISERMGSWRTRVYELRRAHEEALKLGYKDVILDPVVNPPINRGLLQSIIASEELSKIIKAPIMLGLNNAVEMIDVDTHASIASLTLLVAEAGVSIVMVGEESYKARGATREAKRASIMASIALKIESPPKDLGITALDLKGKSPPEGVHYRGYAKLTIEGLDVNCKNIGEVEGVLGEDIRERISKVCTPWVSENLNLAFP